jgi:hypothetical protein
MPQHAVTNGYEKREYLRAQASALSRVVVRKPEGSDGIIVNSCYVGTSVSIY